MNEHLQELKIGGRPMTKLELANKEIERLENIIKEVREYTEIQQKIFDDYDITLDTVLKNILEILDNDEVEITKENNKIKHLEYQSGFGGTDQEVVSEYVDDVVTKVNEIIDYINKENE